MDGVEEDQVTGDHQEEEHLSRAMIGSWRMEGKGRLKVNVREPFLIKLSKRSHGLFIKYTTESTTCCPQTPNKEINLHLGQRDTAINCLVGQKKG